MRQLQQQSTYAKEGCCWCRAVPQRQVEEHNRELQPETGRRTDNVSKYLEPSSLLSRCGTPALMVRAPCPAPPTATPAPLSLPQWGKHPTPPPSASVGVRGVSFNIRGAKTLPCHGSLSPPPFAKAGQASTAPAS